MNVGAMRLTHSCGSSAPTGCTWRNVGASQLKQLQLLIARWIRRFSLSPVGGDGVMTSHVRGTRCSGSKASKVCNTVVPLRGKPTMKSGSWISCRPIPRYTFRSRCMNKREHNMRMRSARRTILAIRLSWASRRQESSNRERPSKKSPPPKSSSPQRRFAVSITSTARRGVRGIGLLSSKAPQPLRSRTGKIGRVRSRVVAEEFIQWKGLAAVLPDSATVGY